MDDYDWLYLALVVAYFLAILALVLNITWLVFLALAVFPIVLFWRCGDGRERKKEYH